MNGRTGAAAGVTGNEQAGVGGAAGEPVGIHVLPADLERRHGPGVAVLRGEDDGGLAGCRGRRDGVRRGAELEGDAIIAGGGDLAGSGRHGLRVVARHEGHGFRAGAQGGAGGIDSGEAVADNDHPTRKGLRPIGALLPQELKRVQAAHDPTAAFLAAAGFAARC